MSTFRLPLRVVFYFESDRWIAHCLDFSLLGDGDTKEEALRSLSTAIAMQVEASVEFNNPRNLFSPADGKYLEMYAKGKDIAVGELSLHIEGFELNKVEAREYAEDDGIDSGLAMAR
ncbi:MAG: hypothetical protein WEB58_14010 [Planctomycetaceae bacterium]